MFITCVLHVRPEGHREPRNEVGSLGLAKCQVGFEPGTFRFWSQCLNPLGHSVQQFTGDTNLVEKSLKQLNKKVNRDLKLTVEWVRTNKLSLNAKKTEIIIFKPRNKTISKHLNFWLSGQKIKPTNQFKQLGVILQEDLQWSKYLSNLGKRLSCSVGLLSSIRHYVPKHLLRTICFSIFNSHLIYACEIWGPSQNSQNFKKLLKLQEKALQIINFQLPTANTTIYFWKLKY